MILNSAHTMGERAELIARVESRPRTLRTFTEMSLGFSSHNSTNAMYGRRRHIITCSEASHLMIAWPVDLELSDIKQV